MPIIFILILMNITQMTDDLKITLFYMCADVLIYVVTFIIRNKDQSSNNHKSVMGVSFVKLLSISRN